MGALQLKNPTFEELVQHPLHLLAFGFGTGLARFAPGTMGTFVGVVFFLIAGSLNLPGYALATALALALGIWICGATARDLGVHDHPGIVWDEIVGYLITMIGLPQDWLWILAGFVVFRLLDILKPWPIKTIDQRVEGGLGIMLDDVVAGIIGCGLLHVAHYLL